jgi:hypothetical protein
MRLPPEESPAASWFVLSLVQFVDSIMDDAAGAVGRPVIMGIDGRSSSGKTTLAQRMCAVIERSSVVHTDDVAWHHSAFGWADLLEDGVLQPLRSGEPVSFRPPAWDRLNRPGAIMVPANMRVVIVEGVGVSRRTLAQALDVTIWVQSDVIETAGRNEARVAGGEISPGGYASWMGEEVPFLAADRPWERADYIVAGTPEIPHDPAREIVVAGPRS